MHRFILYANNIRSLKTILFRKVFRSIEIGRLKKGDEGYHFISENIFQFKTEGRIYHLLPIGLIDSIQSEFSQFIEIEDKGTRWNIVSVGWK